MPVVPSYDNLQTSIRPQAPNLSGPAPGALAAQQMQDAGRAVSDAAGAAGRVLIDMQREAEPSRLALDNSNRRMEPPVSKVRASPALRQKRGNGL